MLSKPTGVQTNQGHTSTDDYITRRYVLPLLTDEESRNRLIAEHRVNPVGAPASNGRPAREHSADLIRVLDKFRRQAMAGKYVTVCMRPFEQYRIGVCSGVRGEPVKVLEEVFSSEAACEHGIFLKRIADLLARYS